MVAFQQPVAQLVQQRLEVRLAGEMALKVGGGTVQQRVALRVGDGGLPRRDDRLLAALKRLIDVGLQDHLRKHRWREVERQPGSQPLGRCA